MTTAEEILDRCYAGPDGCLIYVPRKDKGTYGRVVNEGRIRMVHVVIYEAFVGPIPEGWTVDHLCYVPRCCNPNHLEAVTRAENSRRIRRIKAQVQQTHCKRNHAFTPENTRLYRGERHCRECKRLHNHGLIHDF